MSPRLRGRLVRVTIEPEQIEVFFGDASDALARVYVRVSKSGLPDKTILRGCVIGPHCDYATTLPATISLADKGPGETLLAEAVVPDPCYWTPELPFLYRIQIEIVSRETSSSNSEPMRFERTLGLRRLGVRGKSLYLDGKRFVPRGLFLNQLGTSDIELAHVLSTALMLDAPSDEICELADRRGTLLIARLDTRTHGIEQIHVELARLGRFASVGLAILPADIDAGFELRSFARNVVLVQSDVSVGSALRATSVDSVGNALRGVPGARTTPEQYDGRTEGQLNPWAHARLCELTDQTSLERIASDPSATLIWRRDRTVGVESARPSCDRLQADLASIGDFAGYLV